MAWHLALLWKRGLGPEMAYSERFPPVKHKSRADSGLHSKSQWNRLMRVSCSTG